MSIPPRESFKIPFWITTFPLFFRKKQNIVIKPSDYKRNILSQNPTPHLTTDPKVYESRSHNIPWQSRIFQIKKNFFFFKLKKNRKRNPQIKSLLVTISIHKLLLNSIHKDFVYIIKNAHFLRISKSINEKLQISLSSKSKACYWTCHFFFDISQEHYFLFCSHISFFFSLLSLPSFSFSLLTQNSSF